MINIIMNSNKELIPSNPLPPIYQRESLVDELFFLIPETYNNVSFIGCTAILKYMDVANVAHAEELELVDGLNKDYLTFKLPIDTNITKFAGNINISITLIKVILDVKKQYVLHTGEKVISVLPREDLYAFVGDESLQFIGKTFGEINAKMQALEKMANDYDKNKADNLSYQNNKLQLTSNGQPIGTSVDIVNGGGTSSEDSFEMVEF